MAEEATSNQPSVQAEAQVEEPDKGIPLCEYVNCLLSYSLILYSLSLSLSLFSALSAWELANELLSKALRARQRLEPHNHYAKAFG